MTETEVILPQLIDEALLEQILDGTAPDTPEVRALVQRLGADEISGMATVRARQMESVNP